MNNSKIKDAYLDAESYQRVNGFLEDEFSTFKQNYRAKALANDQVNSSLSMLWVCRFLQPFVDTTFGKRVEEFVEEEMQADDYRHYGWNRISSLQAISYLLTGNKDHLNDLVQHVSCHQSTLRPIILRSCGIIIDDISVKNNQLKDAVEYNLEHSHGYYKESTLLYLCTKGDWKDKKRWFLEARKRYGEYHNEFFEKLMVKNTFNKNNFFLQSISDAKSYFIFKSLTNPKLSDHQTELLSSDASAKQLFQALISEEKKHPLSGYYIDLSFLGEEKFGLFDQE